MLRWICCWKIEMARDAVVLWGGAPLKSIGLGHFRRDVLTAVTSPFKSMVGEPDKANWVPQKSVL